MTDVERVPASVRERWLPPATLGAYCFAVAVLMLC